MRLRFLRSVASVYGGFNVGTVADIPNEALAKHWCDRKVAVEDKSEGETARVRQITPKMPKISKEKPNIIPKGMFWCGKCRSLHRLASPTGIKHLKHQVK